MNRFEIVEAKRWINTVTGATASIYGALPDPDRTNWKVEVTGFTIADNVSNTVGFPSIPFGSSREHCEAVLVKLNKLYKVA